MKKLIKQVGGRKTNQPLKSQKWLLCLLTLLAMFVGSGRMWAEEFVTWTASNTTYTAGQELSNNTALVSVKLGEGTWNYVSIGVTSYQRGENMSNKGTYIEITPSVNINFSLSSYSSANNCNLVMYEGENKLKDFRQKYAQTNDFGELLAGKTYYIFGVSFKGDGYGGYAALDYVYFKSFTATELPPPAITFDADGGTSERDSDPINTTIVLPKATRAGYTFIGWRNNTDDVTPTAGKAGDSFNAGSALTLYALWYKNNCEIDFTSNGPLNGTPNKAGASISETGVFMAGGASVGNITINGVAVNPRFGVQTGTSWIYNNGGLYSNNSGGRAYGISGCVEGEYVTIVSNADPNVNTNDADLVSHDGNTYVYKVKQDCNLKFTPARFTTLFSVSVASPCPHYVYTNGNVGAETERRDWWQNWSPFYKIKKGQTLNFKFTIHGGITTYDNWCLIAQAGLKHNGDLGLNSTSQEKLLVRADGHCWGTNCSGNASITKNGATITVDSEWRKELSDGDFTNDNKNAVVDMTVEYSEGGILTVTAKTIVSGVEKYILTKSSTVISGEDILSLAFEADDSWIEGITHPIKFADTTPTITTSSTGTITYFQPALGNPEGTWVKYEVVSSTGVDNPSISQIEGSPEYFLNIKGTGTVTVQATCGGHTAEYTLTVDGLMFENPSPYIAHGKTEYDAPLTGGAEPDKVEIVKYDTTPCLRGAQVKFEGGTCKIYDIPNGADDGGIIVIRATKGDAVAECCLTVAYDLHVWNMYSDPLVYGSLVEGNAQDAVTGDGDTMNEKSRVGSAHYVVFDPSKSYTYVKPGNEEDETSQDESKTNNNRVEYNNWLDGQDYYYKENWYNDQSGVKTCNADGGLKDYDLLHKYWRFTYKTCQYVNGVRTYVNEPLFAYKNTVIGDNGRIIKQTAGLRYNAPALHFGVSDNDTRDSEGGSTAVREQDRCVILKVGSRLCIPRVKEGRYIRIHWYRHSDNNGDRCRITNGEDLDGKVINPEDVIRFTGSHYYNDHKGSFVFRVKKHGTTTDTKNYETVNGETYCDVFIDPYGIGWTEFYRIEVMDKFDSELQICEVDVAEKITADQIRGKRTQADIGKPQATIDAWNSHDLNDAASYNRNVFDAEKANHPVLASQLTSRITTHAKGATLVKNAPELYISGYPGHCYTWNGWLNTTLQADFMGTSASCNNETKTDGTWSQEKTIPAEAVWVGNNLQYTMHPLKNVHGEGVIKLTLRTHSGWPGEPHYTFDKREAIVAVGQYSVQDYPYTWDFTDYNFGKDNAYGGKTYTSMSDGNVNVEKQYGYWKKDGDAWEMGTYQNSITSKYAVGSYYIDVNDTKKVNLPKFAQGAQLALGTNGAQHTILETEGLRINIPAVDGSNNSAVKLNPKDGSRNGTLSVNGTITIPEVQKGMFVFVRSTNKPTSVVGAVDKNSKSDKPNVINSVNDTFSYTAATVSMAQQDVLDNVWVYEQTTEGKQDVVITPNGAVEAIGVTDIFKLMTKAQNIERSTWVTESRPERIDYSNSGLFTYHNLKSYVVKTKSEVDEDGEGHTDLTEVTVVPGETETTEKRGLVLYDELSASATNATARPLIPLFVPACNIPNSDIAGNRLVDHIEEGNVDVPDEEYEKMRYILTNAYYDYNKATKVLGTEVKHAQDICFYVLRQGSNMRANSSYLDVDRNEASGIKMLYLTFDAIGDEETGINEVAVEVDKETIDTASFYTLSGVKLSGAPTKRGIYIMNGKKVFVSK